MGESSCVLRIHGGVRYHADLISAFGEEACSSHKAGEPVEPDFSFVPAKTWPTDLILVTPQIEPGSGIPRQIDWICSKLQQNAALLRALIGDGGRIDISAWSNSGQGIGDFNLSAKQMEGLAKYGASVFFRFVVNEVFSE